MHEIPLYCPFYSLNTKYTSKQKEMGAHKQQSFKTKFQVKFVCQNEKGTFQFLEFALPLF